ncbi:MAG TPA: MlaD family protein [Gemmatimonadaceae bacterium]|jgi:phospholipid/cholesterol/gamma-HCH transport system substrate-binding protein|nr:MlaD family protein [Gemmatimonadaceae bacterium]
MKRSSFITWDQLKVGVLILVALLILAVAIVKLGAAGNLFGKRYKLVAFVANASGLRVGGPVTVAGQLAGSVKDVEFLPPDNDTTRNLRLVVEVDRSLQEQVRKDSRAKIKTQGLLGDKVFDISVGTPRFPALKNGDTVLIAPSTDYDAVVAQASTAIGQVVDLTNDLKKVTGGISRGEGTLGQLVTNRQLYDNLNASLARTSALMSRLENPRGTIGRLLDDPQLYYSLNRTVASVDTVIRQMTAGNGSLSKLLRDDTLYVHLLSVVSRADSLVGMMSSGNGGTMRKLFSDEQLYDQLVKTVTELNNVLVDVRRDPRRYTKTMIQVKLF